MQDSIYQGAPKYTLYVICKESAGAVEEKHLNISLSNMHNSNREIIKIL